MPLSSTSGTPSEVLVRVHCGTWVVAVSSTADVFVGPDGLTTTVSKLGFLTRFAAEPAQVSVGEGLGLGDGLGGRVLSDVGEGLGGRVTSEVGAGLGDSAGLGGGSVRAGLGDGGGLGGGSVRAGLGLGLHGGVVGVPQGATCAEVVARLSPGQASGIATKLRTMRIAPIRVTAFCSAAASPDA